MAKRLLKEQRELLKQHYVDFVLKGWSQREAYIAACKVLEIDITGKSDGNLKALACQLHGRIRKDNPHIFSQKKEEKKIDDALNHLYKKKELVEITEELREKEPILETLNPYHKINFNQVIPDLDLSTKAGVVKVNQWLLSECMKLSHEVSEESVAFKYVELATKIASGTFHNNVTDFKALYQEIQKTVEESSNDN